MRNEIALDRARRYYDAMQINYGHKFLSQFNGQTNLTYLLETMGNSLTVMSDEQFKTGMIRLATRTDTSDFCPTLKDFASWCVSGSWWSVDEAWQRACDYSNDSNLKITTLAKKAWDSVYWLVIQGNMKAASNEFKSIYNTYLAKAQMQGRQQEWYQEKPSLTWNEEEKKHVPVSNEEAQKHLREFKKKLNVKNRNVAQPQKLKATVKPESVESTWPDPFDNPQGYLQICAVDGIDVDPKIQRQFGGQA